MTRSAIALLVFTLFCSPFLPSIKARITSPFHKLCLNFEPLLSSETKPTALSSLVCGATLKESVSISPWRNLGLIHLLVVSGGHLMILAWCLDRVRTPQWLRILILIFFSLMNRLDPPVLRSLFGTICSKPLRRLGWTAAESILLTTWLCLPFLDGPRELSSLLMSFAASLGLSWAGRKAPQAPLLPQALVQMIAVQTLIWWLLFPLLIPINVAHPAASFSNVLLAPLIGWTLIPLGFATWLLGGPLNSCFEALWTGTNQVLSLLAERLPQPVTSLHSRPLVLLAAFLLMTFYFLGDRAARRRHAKTEMKATAVLITAIVLSLIISTLSDPQLRSVELWKDDKRTGVIQAAHSKLKKQR